MADDWFAKYPGLAFERREHGVLIITLNRPEALNATSAADHLGLSRVWRDIDDDDTTRVVVITGAGDAFSAGGDLEWIGSMVQNYDGMKAAFREAGDIVHRMTECSKVIVSAINGVAVGAGLAVALMADISIMNEEARLTDGHLRLGVAAGDHAVILWPLLCGMAYLVRRLLENTSNESFLRQSFTKEADKDRLLENPQVTLDRIAGRPAE